MAKRTYEHRSPEGFGGPRWTAEEDAYLRDHYETMRADDIAAHLGRSYWGVLRRASAAGLKSRQRAGANSLVPDYFRDIDAPMKAYLLGLLLADGSVSPKNQVKLELAEKDRCLVELARDEIAPKARIRSYHVRGFPNAGFLIQSAALAADLASHGVVHRKTLITAWPTRLPAEHENSFVCGYFDGDGSLGRRGRQRWAITGGTPSFLVELQEHILTQTGIWVGGPYEDKRADAAWSIAATGAPVRELDAWIHRDVPGLTRKRLIRTD